VKEKKQKYKREREKEKGIEKAAKGGTKRAGLVDAIVERFQLDRH